MKTKKRQTLIYHDLGFPIELINVPLKKVLGIWVLDIDMNKLQLVVIRALVHKPYLLTGAELKFIRKYLKLSTTEFGKKLGISHAAIVKWEKEQTHPSPAQEVYIRMFVIESLKNSELTKVFAEITPEKLAMSKNEPKSILPIDLKDLGLAV